MLIIKNARLLTMEDQAFDYGDIAIEGQSIKEVAEHIDSGSGDGVLDATGLWAMPGMVDAHCHLGMWEDGVGEEGADGNESVDPVTPHLRAIDGINPLDRTFTEARAHGVTSVMTGPGSANVLGGMFVTMKTFGARVDEMVIEEPSALKAALGENPKRVYGEQKKTPKTRMATAGLLRQTLIEAIEYENRCKLGLDDPRLMPERSLKLEAVCRVTRREIPLKVHAHRADDIQTALRIADEFGIDVTIDHCTEGHLILDDLRRAGANVVLGPLFSDRPKVEMRNLTFRAPAMFEQAGIPFAIMTDHPVVPIQYLPVCAAIAVREGLSEKAALEAITINAARIAGIDGRVGSLKAGKDADIALFIGHPLDFRSRAVGVWIDGVRVHEA
ncbi:MAG: amidohydrolase [Christensenellales bacterium]|jgi:imidazolonepropionase-like amidohydrolase